MLARVHESRGYRLPSHAQRLFEEAGTRPDFFYDGDYGAAIYIDGPHHDYPECRARDAAQEEAMEDLGYMVIRFGHQDDWTAIAAEYPYVFGDEGQCILHCSNSPYAKAPAATSSPEAME